MLTPEFEAKIRKWVEEYQGSDRGQMPVDTVALLLAEIDKLRAQQMGRPVFPPGMTEMGPVGRVRWRRQERENKFSLGEK